MKNERLLEELALCVHVGLTIGHGLGAYYNARKAGAVDRWTVFHLAAGGLDLLAIRSHLRNLKENA